MRLRILLISLLSLLSIGYVVQPALAFDPVADACNGNTTSSVCTTKQTENPITGKDGIITKVVNILSYAVGIIAVIAIIISAFRFVTSQGDPAALSSAKNTIIYAVIGLVVVVAAQSLVIFVINKL